MGFSERRVDHSKRGTQFQRGGQGGSRSVSADPRRAQLLLACTLGAPCPSCAFASAWTAGTRCRQDGPELLRSGPGVPPWPRSSVYLGIHRDPSPPDSAFAVSKNPGFGAAQNRQLWAADAVLVVPECPGWGRPRLPTSPAAPGQHLPPSLALSCKMETLQPLACGFVDVLWGPTSGRMVKSSCPASLGLGSSSGSAI